MGGSARIIILHEVHARAAPAEQAPPHLQLSPQIVILMPEMAEARLRAEVTARRVEME